MRLLPIITAAALFTVTACARNVVELDTSFGFSNSDRLSGSVSTSLDAIARNMNSLGTQLKAYVSGDPEQMESAIKTADDLGAAVQSANAALAGSQSLDAKGSHQVSKRYSMICGDVKSAASTLRENSKAFKQSDGQHVISGMLPLRMLGDVLASKAQDKDVKKIKSIQARIESELSKASEALKIDMTSSDNNDHISNDHTNNNHKNDVHDNEDHNNDDHKNTDPLKSHSTHTHETQIFHPGRELNLPEDVFSAPRLVVPAGAQLKAAMDHLVAYDGPKAK